MARRIQLEPCKPEREPEFVVLGVLGDLLRWLAAPGEARPDKAFFACWLVVAARVFGGRFEQSSETETSLQLVGMKGNGSAA